jgi:U3 small nucleolar RNA-associated protein 13
LVLFVALHNLYFCFVSDLTLKVWSLESLLDKAVQPLNLKAKALVKAHDKDINSLAIAPNDSLVCSGSQVCNF